MKSLILLILVTSGLTLTSASDGHAKQAAPCGHSMAAFLRVLEHPGVQTCGVGDTAGCKPFSQGVQDIARHIRTESARGENQCKVYQDGVRMKKELLTALRPHLEAETIPSL